MWCNGNITVLGTVAVGSSPTTQILRDLRLMGVCWNLVDRLVLGTSASACGFKSLHLHIVYTGYPSGQRRKTVNLLLYASQVRILPPRAFFY